MDRGVVTGVSRSSQIARVRLYDEEGPEVPARYLGAAPCPRSIVALERFGDGAWVVLGGIGDQRVVLHDDFCAVQATDAGYGDTGWREMGTWGFGGDAAGWTSPDQQGAVQLTTTANAGSWIGLAKEDETFFLDDTAAIWVSARLQVPTIVDVAVLIGLMNDGAGDFSAAGAGDAAVALVFHDAGGANWKLKATNGATSTDTDTGIAVAADTWVDFDLVVVGGSFASLWVDGSGPTTYRGTSLPAANATPTPNPAISLYPDASATLELVVDWIHVERVSSIIAPT